MVIALSALRIEQAHAARLKIEAVVAPPLGYCAACNSAPASWYPGVTRDQQVAEVDFQGLVFWRSWPLVKPSHNRCRYKTSLPVPVRNTL